MSGEGGPSMRVRYEVFLDGRLLRETELIYVGAPAAAADPAGPAGYIDGQYRWMVDQQYIAEDIARAMLDKAAASRPARAAGTPGGRSRAPWRNP
jgi:hypothetical protein